MLLKRFIFSVPWKLLLAPWQQVDWWLLALTMGVTIFGGISIRSAELNQGITDWWQHWLFGGVGLALAFFLSLCRYDFLLRWHWLTYAVTNVSLIAVMLAGISAKGAQRWISIAGFNFQPSEFAKVGMIITLAALLQSRSAGKIPGVLRALLVSAVPWALVFAQPDLGTSLVFGAITLGMLYWGNVNPGWLILLISPIVAVILFNVYLPAWFIWAVAMGAIAFVTMPWRWLTAISAIGINFLAGELGHVLWGLLKDYQKDRIILFLNPEKDPLGGGYHLIQSRIAIGSGQLWGQGLYQGTQTQLNFIPEQHTDFIFSAVGEEWGFIGCLVLLFIFWLICLRLVLIAQSAKDDFGSLLVIGVFSTIVFQVIVNISMTIGLAPVTGIPLPWMSYGRSALLTNWIAIGIVQSVANYRPKKKGRGVRG